MNKYRFQIVYELLSIRYNFRIRIKTFTHELTLDEIDVLTKNLGKSLLNVNLTGGEPFARKDLTEIAKKYLHL